MSSGMDTSSFEAEPQESKRRKVMEKSIVTVKIEANEGRKKGEGPPSDNWSWRKYGQKPIKGSPFPRGYYRCSTSKGCSAKKQVERCKTDASLLIITYTSTHNHPSPDTPAIKHSKHTKSSPSEDPSITPKQEPADEEQQQNSDGNENENHFHYFQSPLNSSDDIMIDHRENPFVENIESTYGSLGILLDEEPFSCNVPLMDFSKVKSEEYDFYDELEELPMSSIFTSLMNNDLFEEGILVHPS